MCLAVWQCARTQGNARLLEPLACFRGSSDGRAAARLAGVIAAYLAWWVGLECQDDFSGSGGVAVEEVPAVFFEE
eukprot:15206395-Heterocapsa_arctica.AAC.1